MDYMALFLMICAASLMGKIAEYEKRRGWLWGLITVGLAVLLSSLIASKIVFFLATVLTAYCSMFVLKILEK